jgi:hypothetical protein
MSVDKSVVETRQVDVDHVHQEVAYRDMPPALEDPTIQGLLRISNQQRLRTVEQRDDVEYDYRWYRYASHSFPLLSFVFLLAVATLSLSLWQNNGDLGHQLGGVPRTLVPHSIWEDDHEAGITDHLWQVRSLGAVTAGLAALIGIKLYFSASSVGYGNLGQLRLVKLQYVLAAFLAFVGVVAYVVAFSMAIGNVQDVQNLAEGARFTFEEPDNKEEIHTWVTTFDLICFGFALVAIYVLVKHGFMQGDLIPDASNWKQAGRVRDMDEKGPTRWYAPRKAAATAAAPAAADAELIDGVPAAAAKKQKKAAKPAFILRNHFHNVRFVKSTFGLLVLLCLLASVIISITGVILMHRYRYAGRVYGTNNGMMAGRGLGGSSDDYLNADDDDAISFGGVTEDFERSGWPVKNQRLRIGVSGSIIAIFLFLLVPFRHRLIHWIATLFIFLLSVGFFAAFVFDINALLAAKDAPCPYDYQSLYNLAPGATTQPTMVSPYVCRYDMFHATVVMDFFAGAFSLAYVVLEVFIRKACVRKEKDPNTGKMVAVQQCGRKFGFFEAATHTQHLCSMRRVKCAETGELMVAKYFVYRHMFDVLRR